MREKTVNVPIIGEIKDKQITWYKDQPLTPTKMKKIKKLYLIDPKMKWGSFKALQDKMCIPDGGPTPQHLDKYLWQMNRDKHVFLYFCEEMKGDMGIGIKLPPHKEMVVLSNPKK